MSISINGVEVSVVHLRHDGRSYDVFASDISTDSDLTSPQLLTAIEDHLDLSAGELSGYEIDVVESTGTSVIHPAAKFGEE